MQQRVQRPGGGEVGAERFLDDDAAAGRERGSGQAVDGGREERRWQGEVDDDGARRAGDGVVQRDRVGDVTGHVGDALDHLVADFGFDVGRVSAKPSQRVLAVARRVLGITGDAEHLKPAG